MMLCGIHYNLLDNYIILACTAWVYHRDINADFANTRYCCGSYTAGALI